MVQIESIIVTAIEAKRNYSYGQEMREVWYRRQDGIEGNLQYTGPFGIRSGNRLGLVFSAALHGRWLAVVNFSTEQYINFVPNWATRKTYPFAGVLFWPLSKAFPQLEESAYGSQSPEIHQAVEARVRSMISQT